jgi:hypothetical protein
MVKAFSVNWRETISYSIGVMGGSVTYGSQPQDNRPIIVIANSIKEVAEKYSTASKIEEISAKEVVVLEKVICPVK